MKKQKGLLLAILVWILIVVVGYYYYHKPITFETLENLISVVLDLLLTFGLFGLAGGLGSCILKLTSLSALERACIQAALGLAILGFFWMAIGWMHLFTPLTAWIIILVGLVLLRRNIRDWASDFGSLSKMWGSISWLEKALSYLVVFLVGYTLLISLAPPLKFDALLYHLQLPLLYLDACYFMALPENQLWGYPQLIEMIYTFAMALHRPETAALVGWGVGILGLLGMGGFVNRLVSPLADEQQGRSAFWITVAAVITGTTYRHMLGWAYSDQFSALFGICAIIAFYEWLSDSRKNHFWLTFLFAGLAISVKFTSGVLFLGVFLASLFVWKRKALKPVQLLIGGFFALIPLIPMLIRNALATGNPIFPFIFPTEYFSASRLALANAVAGPVEWLPRLALPISMTWMGVDNAGLFMADIGPLLLLLAVPGGLAYRKDFRIRALAWLLVPAALALSVSSIWFTHLIQPRLYFAVLPVVAVFAGLGWNWMQAQTLVNVRLRNIIGALVLLVMALVTVSDTMDIVKKAPLGTILGIQTNEAYLRNNLGYYAVSMEALNDLPAGSKTLMLWEGKGFYAPINTKSDLWLDQFLTDWREQGSVEAVIRHWESEGFTHVLLFQSGVDFIKSNPSFYTAGDWAGLDETLSRLMLVENFGDAYLLFEMPEG